MASKQYEFPFLYDGTALAPCPEPRQVTMADLVHFAASIQAAMEEPFARVQAAMEPFARVQAAMEPLARVQAAMEEPFCTCSGRHGAVGTRSGRHGGAVCTCSGRHGAVGTRSGRHGGAVCTCSGYPRLSMDQKEFDSVGVGHVANVLTSRGRISRFNPLRRYVPL